MYLSYVCYRLTPTFTRMQRAALENIAKVVKAAGSDLAHVVKVNVYLIDLSQNFAPMNEAYLKVPSRSFPSPRKLTAE